MKSTVKKTIKPELTEVVISEHSTMPMFCIKPNFESFSNADPVFDNIENNFSFMEFNIFDKQNSKLNIGCIKAVLINDSNIINEGNTKNDIVDTISYLSNDVMPEKSKHTKELDFMFDIVEEIDGDIKEELFEKDSELEIFSGLLIITDIEIKKQFRGKKISILALNQIISKFHMGAKCVVMNVIEPRLQDYFSIVGFYKLKNTDGTLVHNAHLICPNIFEINDYGSSEWIEKYKKLEKKYVKDDNFELAAKMRDKSKMKITEL